MLEQGCGNQGGYARSDLAAVGAIGRLGLGLQELDGTCRGLIQLAG